MSDYIDQFSELLANPLGNLISSIGKGVGEAQAALDAGSLAQTLDMYRQDANASPEEQETLKLMRDMGYQPTFYAIPETEVEAQVSLSLGVVGNGASSPLQSPYQSKLKVYATPLNAGNINKYNLNANAYAKIKFKIVPVPPEPMVADMRVVPDFSQMPLDQVKELLASYGLNYQFINDVDEAALNPSQTIVKSSIPSPNAVVKLGDTITLII